MLLHVFEKNLKKFSREPELPDFVQKKDFIVIP